MLNEIEKKAVDELIEKLKETYGENLVKVILYGSKARGDQTDDSDIDILVVLGDYVDIKKERFKIYDIVWSVCYIYDLLISVIIKNKSDYEKFDTGLLKNIKNEGIELWKN
jgi:predicted nucleotidyltransferase